MKCCDNPELIVEKKGQWWYFYCLEKGCKFASPHYGTQNDAEIALQKHKYLTENAQIILPGNRKRQKLQRKLINYSEVLNPVIRAAAYPSVFFSDRMIEKCALPIHCVTITATRRENENGPFLYIHFYATDAEVPKNMIENIVDPYRKKSKKNPEIHPKGIDITLSFSGTNLLKVLGISYFPTTILPFTMDLKDKRKMIVDIGPLYEKKSDEPLMKFTKDGTFRKKNKIDKT